MAPCRSSRRPVRAGANGEAAHDRTINPPLNWKVKPREAVGFRRAYSKTRRGLDLPLGRKVYVPTKLAEQEDRHPVGVGAVTFGRCLGAVLLATALSACGGGGEPAEDPLALDGKASTPCTQAIMDGHNHEGAGQPTPVAFLPSIQECRSLAEWTAAAMAFGINLRGREAQFVDNTCNATTTSAEVKASRICQEAKAEVADLRRAP